MGDPEPAGVLQVLLGIVVAQPERRAVQVDQLGLALELLGQKVVDGLEVEAEQRGQRADIDDVLEELALARDRAVHRVGELGQRHAQHRHVAAQLLAGERLGRIVEHVAAAFDLGDVLVPGLRVHQHREVDAAAAPEPALARDPHLVPGRQALDVRREDVARRHGHAHAHHRAGEELVGRRRARAVDVGELDDEVVGGGDGGHLQTVSPPPCGEVEICEANSGWGCGARRTERTPARRARFAARADLPTRGR